MKRRPEVFLRQAEVISVGRARCFNRENVNELYEKLHTLIDMHEFDATRMFIMDESGITTVQCMRRKAKQNRLPYKWEKGRQYNNGVLHECKMILCPTNGDFQT